MGKKIFIEDEIGKKYGQWEIIKQIANKNGRRYVLCKCKCGKIKEIRFLNLKYSKTRKCLNCSNVLNFKIHNSYKTRLYSIWKGIKKRCFNENSKDYKNYGGRGIIVCDEWKNNFLKFKEWSISNGYLEYLTIDRIDNNLGYSSKNCRWITNLEQQLNKRPKK